MKKLFYLVFACSALLLASTACHRESQEQSQAPAENLDSINNVLRDSLQNARAEMDTLMSLMSEVSDGLSEIKDLEKIVSSTNFNSETADRRDQIRNDVELIKLNVQDRLKKLDQLERNLQKSNSMNEQLKTTIDSMRRQLKDQQAMIDDLTQKLEAAHVEIRTLNTRVDSLKTENTEVKQERQQVQAENVKLTNEKNECYYVIGSNKELKQHKIIEKRFLGKTKIMEGDFSRSYFTKADRRTLNKIQLHSKKAKVLSKHPKNSYQIVDEGGQKVLHITDAALFWDLSNYLVIQVD